MSLVLCLSVSILYFLPGCSCRMSASLLFLAPTYSLLSSLLLPLLARFLLLSPLPYSLFSHTRITVRNRCQANPVELQHKRAARVIRRGRRNRRRREKCGSFFWLSEADFCLFYFSFIVAVNYKFDIIYQSQGAKGISPFPKKNFCFLHSHLHTSWAQSLCCPHWRRFM